MFFPSVYIQSIYHYMKHIFSALLATLVFAGVAQAQNPIIQTKYTSDPAPYVHGDTVYLFTDHDNAVRDGYDMTEWLLYTSTDMVNWTDHGPVASLADYGRWASTADNGAWASQVLEYQGKWYMYNAIQLRGVGVLCADSPYGPWTDPKKQHLFNFSINDIDPTVYVDDDGQPYIYWGNNGLWYAKLDKERMYRLKPINKRYTVPLTEATVGGYKVKNSKGGDSLLVGSDCFEEASWVYKRGSKYYLVYAGGPIPEHLSYAMADSITGPWKYMGKIQNTPENSFTTHPAVIDYKGHSYLFTHSGQLKGGNGFHRSVCAMEFHYNDDGTIPFLTLPPKEGNISPVGHLDALSRQEAETINYANGITTHKDSSTVDVASNKVYVEGIDNNDYIRVRSVNFGNDGVGSINVCVRSGANAGSIILSIDNVEMTTINVPSDLVKWTVLSATLPDKVTGIHNITFTFKASGKNPSERKNLFAFDYWQFLPGATDIQSANMEQKTGGRSRVYDLNGRCVGSSLKGLPQGLYVYDGRKVMVTE